MNPRKGTKSDDKFSLVVAAGLISWPPLWKTWICLCKYIVRLSIWYSNQYLTFWPLLGPNLLNRVSLASEEIADRSVAIPCEEKDAVDDSVGGSRFSSIQRRSPLKWFLEKRHVVSLLKHCPFYVVTEKAQTHALRTKLRMTCGMIYEHRGHRAQEFIAGKVGSDDGSKKAWAHLIFQTFL